VIALTRDLPSSIGDCELTHLEREPIDVERASHQHERYEQCLVSLGCMVQRLPPLPDRPDSVFVEDTAIVLPDFAIIARPGAESRRPEVASVEAALLSHRPLSFIESPGTLDGGDVLVVGSTVYVGRSGRTNAEGVRQLTELAGSHGYVVRPVQLSGCLHLKSAVTQVGKDLLLVNPEWVDSSSFDALHQIAVHPAEPFAANALRVGETVIFPAGYEGTQELMERRGIDVRLVEIDELQKAEGGVTCCSILIPE
jgi:dimethylargininase